MYQVLIRCQTGFQTRRFLKKESGTVSGQAIVRRQLDYRSAMRSKAKSGKVPERHKEPSGMQPARTAFPSTVLVKRSAGGEDLNPPRLQKSLCIGQREKVLFKQ